MSKRYANGYNADVATAAEIVARNAAGLSISGIAGVMKTAQTVDIVSTDAKDTAAGVGARTIGVTYLDENLVEKYVVKSLAGAVDVEIENVRAVLKMRVLTTGSENDNAGVISAENVGNNDLCVITAAQNVSDGVLIGVPVDKQLIIERVYATGTDVDNTVNVVAVDESGDAYNLLTAPLDASGVDMQPEIVVNQKSLVYMTALTGANTEAISVGMVARLR